MLEKVPDFPKARKARGAFFTPPEIASYLAEHAIEGDPAAVVLDPTCGESVFLEAAASRLRELGAPVQRLREQVLGVDIHANSLERSEALLKTEGLTGAFIKSDFFALSTPDRLDASLPYVDAVIGNPPFIRYQDHAGLERKRAQQAALAQGVRLSGLASSWAALVIHACGFLKPEGRLAMVLPAELLSTGYAEPVRRWLKNRFKAVHLVMFERLQFDDALERVVLVLARGSGGTKAFTLVPIGDASELRDIRMFGPNHLNVAPAEDGKWTDFLLPVEDRQLLDRVLTRHFAALDKYGSPTLGAVTGANSFSCISETTRRDHAIDYAHVLPIAPPGTKRLLGLSFSQRNWESLRDQDQAVWLLHPDLERPLGQGLEDYIELGKSKGVPGAYKCRIREPWFRPPAVPAPDLFFTYMSHRYPRLIANTAGASFVNSMHGVRLKIYAPAISAQALPLLMLNSATMLGAEIFGRSYGGGVLKMEPREAASLPVPHLKELAEAWRRLKPERPALDRQLRQGLWVGVVKRVDDALLRGACGLSEEDVRRLHGAAQSLRERRIGT